MLSRPAVGAVMSHFNAGLCQSLRVDARAALLFCSWNLSLMSYTEEVEALWNLISIPFPGDFLLVKIPSSLRFQPRQNIFFKQSSSSKQAA